MGGRYFIGDNLMYDASSSNAGCSTASLIGHQLGTYGNSVWAVNISANSPTTGQATATAINSQTISGTPPCPSTTGTPNCIGMNQTDIVANLDHVSIYGCDQDAALDTPSGVIYGSYSGQLLGPIALTGTNGNSPDGLTVVYPSTGSTSDFGGNCRLTNIQGGPFSFNYVHNSFITDKAAALTVLNSQTNGASFAVNNQFRDSITTGPWYGRGYGIPEGTSTEQWYADTTSLTADHLLFVTSNGSNYTAYGNDPNAPVTPPFTMFFPTNSCLGWIGSCSGSLTISPPFPDYHSYGLSPSSPYYSAGTLGSSLGADVTSIDTYQTGKTFLCPYTCGSPGPYPDN
jgi:hypothetical protein